MSHELLGCYANVWIRQKSFGSVGETIGGHKHKYDHLSILAVGKVAVEVDGITKAYEAPTFLVIPKDKVHNVTALTEGVVWYCVFAHRDVTGQVYDPELHCPADPGSCSSLINLPQHVRNVQSITIEEETSGTTKS